MARSAPVILMRTTSMVAHREKVMVDRCAVARPSDEPRDHGPVDPMGKDEQLLCDAVRNARE
jgi:hypothetical protein